MNQFTFDDLRAFAETWVNRSCQYSPGSESAQIMIERIEKELLRIFEAAGEPLV